MGILKAKKPRDDMLIILSTVKIERPHLEFPLSQKCHWGILLPWDQDKCHAIIKN